jgi:hypothetical protein
MEFSIWCPTDGTVEVDLEDVDSIVVRSGSDVEVVFVCPVCGRHITFAAQIPHALLAGLDDAWVRVEDREASATTLRRESGPEVTSPSADVPLVEDSSVESYCEYFRRELAEAETVEAMLALMDMSDS